MRLETLLFHSHVLIPSTVLGTERVLSGLQIVVGFEYRAK